MPLLTHLCRWGDAKHRQYASSAQEAGHGGVNESSPRASRLAVLVLGVLTKQFFWPAKKAEVNGGPSMDITQLHNDTKNLPA